MSTALYDLFAITAPGLSELCARELSALGVDGIAEPAGVAWRGDVLSMYRANLHVRTASRIIARVGEFRARGFPELERHAAKLPWRDFLTPGAQVVLRVTCRKSRLYHEGAVAERVARVLADAVGAEVVGSAPDDERDAASDDRIDDAAHARVDAAPESASVQLVIVRFLRDTCTISLDSSGRLLHLRGYRQALAKAPVRETIAAAVLLAADWRGDTPLVDPLCGSGTIPIEAALIARRIAPGLARRDLAARPFAFQRWPGYHAPDWTAIVESARAEVTDARVPIVGADRDAGAIAAARANAERAGVEGDVTFERGTLRQLEPPPGRGSLVTNPPYGVRVGDRQGLRPLYADIGRVAATRLAGWDVTLLVADDALARATGLPLRPLLATRNGGIPVRVVSTAGVAPVPVVGTGPVNPALAETARVERDPGRDSGV